MHQATANHIAGMLTIMRHACLSIEGAIAAEKNAKPGVLTQPHKSEEEEAKFLSDIEDSTLEEVMKKAIQDGSTN